MSTLVKNGTIVTASDRYDADIYIDKGVITLIGQGLNIPADTVIDASGKLVMPGGIDVHTHLDMPFGGTTSADDFETGTIAAAHGGTTTLIDFAIQTFGEGLYPAFDGWMKKAEGKAGHRLRLPHDRARAHRPGLARHGQDGAPRRASPPSSCSWPTRASSWWTTPPSSRPCCRTRENGGLVCMHAENGGVIDTLVKEALRKGQTAPKYHALTRPTRAEGRGHRPRHRPRRDGGRADLHRAPLLLGRAREDQAGPRHGPARLRRDLPAVPLPVLRRLRAAGLRRREVRDVAAAAREVEPGRALEGPPEERPPGGLHRPLPVLHERGGPEAARQGRLLEDPQRRARASRPGSCCSGTAGVRTGRIDAHRFVELVSTNPAKMFGLWPRKGTIAVGSDGDLVLWDPERETTLSAKTHHMRVDYNPYEGRVVKGAPAMVLSRGEVIVDHGAFKGAAGARAVPEAAAGGCRAVS